MDFTSTSTSETEYDIVWIMPGITILCGKKFTYYKIGEYPLDCVTHEIG